MSNIVFWGDSTNKQHMHQHKLMNVFNLLVCEILRQVFEFEFLENILFKLYIKAAALWVLWDKKKS